MFGRGEGKKGVSVVASVRDTNERECSRKQNQYIKSFVIQNYQVQNLPSCRLSSSLKADREGSTEPGRTNAQASWPSGRRILLIGEGSILYFVQTLKYWIRPTHITMGNLPSSVYQFDAYLIQDYFLRSTQKIVLSNILAQCGQITAVLLTSAPVASWCSFTGLRTSSIDIIWQNFRSYLSYGTIIFILISFFR